MKELTATGEANDNYEQTRDHGMRPIQMWVADVRTEGFAAEAHRQSAAVAASEHAADEQALIDALSSDAG